MKQMSTIPSTTKRKFQTVDMVQESRKHTTYTATHVRGGK